MAEFVGEDISPIARVIFIIIASAEVITGVVGNIFLLLVLFTSRLINARSFHNLFVADLAIVDLVTLGYWVTFFVLDLILGHQPVANKAHCIANGFIVSLCSLVGILSLVTISLNRYLHVCHSQLYSRLFTWKTTVVICIMLWVFAAAMTTPPLFVPEWGYTYHTKSHTCTFSEDIYPKTVVVLTFFGTTLVVCYLNLAIFRFWKKTKRNVHHHLAATSSDKQQTEPWFCFCLKGVRKRELKESSGSQNGCDNQLQTVNTATQNTPSAQNHQRVLRCFSCIALCARGSEQTKQQKGPTETSQSATPVTLNSSDTAMEDSELETYELSETNELDDFEGQRTDSAEELEKMTETVVDRVNTKDGFGHTGSEEKHNAHANSKSSSDNSRTSNRRKVAHRHQQKQRKERAFVRSLLVICLLMFICFLPFGIVSIVSVYQTLSPETTISLALLLFFNNSVNWVVYGAMNRTYRKEYVRLFKTMLGMFCRCRKQGAETNST